MTPEQILADIKSDRVKKVIMDGDYSAEIDDQYTLAYAYGHEKIEVLGVIIRLLDCATYLPRNTYHACRCHFQCGVEIDCRQRGVIQRLRHLIGRIQELLDFSRECRESISHLLHLICQRLHDSSERLNPIVQFSCIEIF